MSDHDVRALGIDQVIAQQGDDVLTSEQTRALAQRMERGDAAAREQLILRNTRLVFAQVASEQRGARRDDLFQDGMTGLIRAVDGFDWRRGIRFSTYATYWIRRNITLGRHATRERALSLHERSAAAMRMVRTIDDDRRTRHETRLTDAEMAARVGVGERLVQELREGPQQVFGLDLALDAEDEMDVHAQVTRALHNDAVRAAVDALDPVARSVIALRKGGESSLRQVARELGISHERVRLIEREAMEQLGESLASWQD